MEYSTKDPVSTSDANPSLSLEQKIRVKELARLISPAHPHTLVHYGADMQDKLARLADNMLNQVRSHQAEEQIGAILHALLDKLREINPDELLTPQRGFIARLFGGSSAKVKQKLLVRCQRTNHEMERMADTLERLRHQMLRDTTMLDVLYAKNREYFNELNVYIAAAREKLEEVREHMIPILRETAEKSGNDPLQIQKLMDMERFADRLEQKLQDLLISQTIALQTAPQIRLIQENHGILMEKIHSSVLSTIPLWKSQMVILLSLLRQQDALIVQRQTSQAVGEALKRNTEVLQKNARKTFDEQERTTAELSAFKETQEELMAVLEETLHIQQEGSEKRRRIEQELGHIEQRTGDKSKHTSHII
ncbi:toxic anion resistance protein [Aneurinibacillus aneurinilyticus]|nr:toxic anion resistance protein [Aneurinibacillus aneurinilyticus]MCI1695051.1 toxic anion resistance protein [Aneurinibacillus aneurinilyticus]MED0706638.1 toxic anion resistance protein [Aneurinibacillus aneurinilyticus]MED0723599.1 toxic anion resistance protein [Aneurinibacillus aneurinilyticus]MED0731721.1 toxic anion resistance protein [Aneurinibacillus aneurinilyticus]MED0742033.1 toxic anion resistance protein [Aneurinibacillus aneurinilyticus]